MHRSLSPPKDRNDAEHQAARPKEPTPEDVEKEVDKRREANRELMEAARARTQQRADSTVEQRLKALEAFVDSQLFPPTVDADRQRVRADLRGRYLHDVENWEMKAPGRAAGRAVAYRSPFHGPPWWATSSPAFTRSRGESTR